VSGTTLVRVRPPDSEHLARLPADHPNRAWVLRERRFCYTGRFVLVALPPEAPGEEWTCGTRWVWRVTEAEAEAERVCRRRCVGARPFSVCEHMVEVD